jgi:hypothetical protein
MPGLRAAAARHRSAAALRRVERGLPVPAVAVDHLRRRRPDVLLVTPLVVFRATQSEWLRAAHELGVPTVLCVHSWDNLTNKALIHGDPDLVTVWNDAQKAEAVELHGVAPERVAVVGAHPYDHWFARRPSDDAAGFRARVGLPAGGPLLLYLCSSRQIAPAEERFIVRWLDAVRRSGDPRLREAAVLVRPHPANPGDFARLRDDRVAVWPRDGVNPIADAARQDFYDSMAHADAVVGLNTSAQIEAAILGKPVLSVLVPEFRTGQDGTLHFRHLLRENGGPVWLAPTLERHVADLTEAVAAPGPDPAAEAFVRRFVRPFGIDAPATPHFADAIERVAAGTPARAQLPEPTALGPALERALRYDERRRSLVARVRAARDFVAEAQEELDRLLEPDGPVLIGPWRGEVGFELLYWIPFVRWAVDRRPELRDRITVVSRGGTASWYGDLAPRYLDVFALAASAPLELGDEELITRAKPREIGPVDRELIRRAGAESGAPFGPVLHPWSFFRLYRDLRKSGQLPRLDEVLAHRPLDPPRDRGPLDGVLPERYAASRFYFNPPFPDTPDNRRFAAAVQYAIAAHGDVALLNSGLSLDDHEDLPRPDDDRIVDLTPYMRAHDNLHLQSLAVAGADFFVGTYGGLSYLPPFYGVPSVSFLADQASMLPHHLALAQRLFAGPEYGAFYALDPRDAGLLERVLGVAARVGAPEG